ncbi:MAG: hypothetical protein HON27_02915 [Candidatus Marinimicrobia bacterium]|jgi:methionyl-tRNA formyltransferase|nr:hypothetical protein [Candidatus Neomarinimicrobiota bacterium]MBT5270209.1 hypothetical protein [Candidatus Neomarinimicrobiota bacterium]MBT6011085.1 hypothetical protein [Candidatus Neomarinimicrobiota bacterium]
MNILFLTNKNASEKEDLVDFIKMYGDSVIIHYGEIDVELLKSNKIDFVVSDRYDRIISADVLRYIEGRAINTHPSLLPLNRGWQPNFFSIYNRTKKGVSIHVVDDGLDTGPVFIQKEIFLNDDDTLRTSHYILRKTIVSLFCENWFDILHGNVEPIKQGVVKSINYKSEFDRIFPCFSDGWDTKVKHLNDDSI